jgi:hypothetical protein
MDKSRAAVVEHKANGVVRAARTSKSVDKQLKGRASALVSR